MMHGETRSGGPRSVPRAAKAFVSRQRERFAVGLPIAAYAPSNWIRKMVRDRSSFEDVLTMARARLLRAPEGLAPREAVMLANEFSRTREGAALIRDGLTQQQIDEVFKGGRRR